LGDVSCQVVERPAPLPLPEWTQMAQVVRPVTDTFEFSQPDLCRQDEKVTR
jgi:hypothetical protein